MDEKEDNMKYTYINKAFRQSTLDLINQGNTIIDEYLSDGLTLTLRQLYYQFVARSIIPNNQKEYNRLGSIISDARLAGLIDWDAIEDRTRNLQSNSHWANPGEIIRSAAYGFRVDHWEGQDYRPEVWIEKEALIGVIANICEDLDVDYFACKGYISQSEMYRAAQRTFDNQDHVIIHLGDHDPSGIDMTRDISDRFGVFESTNYQVIRIALNMDQVEDHQPPPNPAKMTDSRFNGYIVKYGNDSWELDALDPRTLRDLIEKTVLQYRNEETYQKVIEKENEYKRILEKVEKEWKTL